MGDRASKADAELWEDSKEDKGANAKGATLHWGRSGHLEHAKSLQAFRAGTARTRERPQNKSLKLPRGAFCATVRADSESANENSSSWGPKSAQSMPEACPPRRLPKACPYPAHLPLAPLVWHLCSSMKDLMCECVALFPDKV
eukprot:12454709-Alexandrium_andersonii.AAC.1